MQPHATTRPTNKQTNRRGSRRGAESGPRRLPHRRRSAHSCLRSLKHRRQAERGSVLRRGAQSEAMSRPRRPLPPAAMQDRYGLCRVGCAAVRRDGRPPGPHKGRRRLVNGGNARSALGSSSSRVRPGPARQVRGRQCRRCRAVDDDNDRRHRQRTKRAAEGEGERTLHGASYRRPGRVVGRTDHRTGRRNWSPPPRVCCPDVTGLTQNVSCGTPACSVDVANARLSRKIKLAASVPRRWNGNGAVVLPKQPPIHHVNAA